MYLHNLKVGKSEFARTDQAFGFPANVQLQRP